jgi:NAD-dependent SIR2 family protein deacetylase
VFFKNIYSPGRPTIAQYRMSFAVVPIDNCPHEANVQEAIDNVIANMTCETVLDTKCSLCDGTESWICLSCQVRFCSRYENGHMLEHNEQSGHCVAFSLSDGSCWCYGCDSYIVSSEINKLRKYYGELKFPDEAITEFDENATTAKDSFTKESFLNGLRDRSFTNIVVVTGAGISVASGIPDFRSPETGLYAHVAKLGLPRPESIFTLDFFKVNPLPFASIAKQFLLENENINPVNAHYFVKTLDDNSQLLMNFTQNIDGLELKAGLPLNKLVQAHGHSRTAHCCTCGSEAEISTFVKACENDEALLCLQCDHGFVKPDIVFFGESLSGGFHQKYKMINQADLVIVMGTSLKVYPFAFLIDNLASEIPLVLINRENPGLNRDNFLFLPGDIENTIKDIMAELNWDIR